MGELLFITERYMQAIRLRSMRQIMEQVPDWPEQGPQSGVGDLIGNLLHYCKVRKIDFDRALAMGYVHFEEEDHNLDWERLAWWTEKWKK